MGMLSCITTKDVVVSVRIRTSFICYQSPLITYHSERFKLSSVPLSTLLQKLLTSRPGALQISTKTTEF